MEAWLLTLSIAQTRILVEPKVGISLSRASATVHAITRGGAMAGVVYKVH